MFGDFAAFSDARQDGAACRGLWRKSTVSNCFDQRLRLPDFSRRVRGITTLPDKIVFADFEDAAIVFAPSTLQTGNWYEQYLALRIDSCHYDVKVV